MALPDARPVALVLGSGPRLGYALMRHFASHGYRVVGARRNLVDAESLAKEGIILIGCEVGNKDEVDQLWPTIEEKLGQPPSVVIFEGKNHLNVVRNDRRAEVFVTNSLCKRVRVLLPKGRVRHILCRARGI